MPFDFLLSVVELRMFPWWVPSFHRARKEGGLRASHLANFLGLVRTEDPSRASKNGPLFKDLLLVLIALEVVLLQGFPKLLRILNCSLER